MEFAAKGRDDVSAIRLFRCANLSAAEELVGGTPRV